MIFRSILFTVLSCFALADTECPAVSSHNDRRYNNNSNTFKIMQYNAQWLFVDYYGSSKCPGTGCDWVNETEALTHMDFIAEIIDYVDADIVNLCEVEGCDELNLLVEKINNAQYIPYLKKGTDTATGQNVGLITKIDPEVSLYRTDERVEYPVPNSNCGYTGTPTTSAVSKHYVTEFKLNNVDIAIISAHLIAFPTDKTRCSQREAQTQVLQNIIYDYISRGYEVIMIGDFNDFDAEILDVNDSKPISKALDTLKGLFGIYSGKYQLKSAAELIPKNRRGTDWYDKNGDCISVSTEFSMIDHILVSPFLYDKILYAYTYQGYEEFCGTYNSDHYPVIIELVL